MKRLALASLKRFARGEEYLGSTPQASRALLVETRRAWFARGAAVAAPENAGYVESPSPPAPGSGDACIAPPSSFPCANGVTGFQEQYPHTIQRYAGSDGETLVEMWSIHGLGHA